MKTLTDQQNEQQLLPRRCPFHGCQVMLPSHLFACRPHWYSLPPAGRQTVWNAYGDWQTGRIDGDRLREIQQQVLGERGTA